MTILKINSITCRRTQEAIDEPYLRAVVGSDSRIIWGPQSMDDGDSTPVDWSVTFWVQAQIQLWEHDRRRHDHIGDLTIDLNNSSPHWEEGDKVIRLRGRGAEYDLHYTLERIDRPENFRLNLITLHCDDAQERRDEPYLIVNGRTIWRSTSSTTNQTHDLDRNIYYSGNATVELWEYDGARSDWFGTMTLRPADIGSGIRGENHRFHRDRGITGDAIYTLRYGVQVIR